MKQVIQIASRVGLAALVMGWAGAAQAQAPYALPYTINVFAGGGTPLAPAAPAPAACLPTSVTGTTYDNYGDGCQVTSASVAVGVGQATGNIHDIVVDPQGNVYFLDITSTSKTAIRRVDARSGVVTIAAGSLTTQSVCSTATDSYGDGCQATDGLANALGLHTTFPTLRGFAVAKNGDLYLTGYSTNVVQKISMSTGVMTLIGGTLSGTGKSASGATGFGGNGGPATAAHFASPRGIAVDNAGNVYIADSGNNEIRVINGQTGIVNVVAGSSGGVSGATGDGGPATSALLATPEGVDVDAAGDVFIADFGNARVRVVYNGGPAAAKLIAGANPGVTPQAGYIYTVLGGGTAANPNGTYALGTTVSAGNPRKLRVDAMGNLYVADNGNNVIDFIDAATGFTHVIAGSSGLISGGPVCTPVYGKTDAFGDGCVATSATLSSNSAMSVATDAVGNIYISDSGHDLVRKVSTNRDFPAIVTGTSLTQTLDIHFAPADGPALANAFTVTGNADFVVGTPNCTVNTDTTQDCLVPVTFSPTRAGRETAVLSVTSLLNGKTNVGVQGSGVGASLAFDPGSLSVAVSGLSAPQSVVVDAAGNSYVADTGHNQVLQISASGTKTVIAGTGVSGFSGDNGPAAAANLAAPSSVTLAPGGLLYIADSGNNAVRMVNLTTGLISTAAGRGSATCTLARDAQGDGCAGNATTFAKPSGVVADAVGNVYVADTGNNLLREITAGGFVEFIAGGATVPCTSTTLAVDSYGNNCAPTQAIFNGPTGLALDASNNLFVADTANSQVREVNPATNLVVNVAGTGVAGAGSTGGPAVAAQVNTPTGVAVDAAGNVYIADTGNHAVRMVAGNGNLFTLAGTLGTSGGGTPGSSLTTLLSAPSSVAVLPGGSLMVLDAGNSRLLTDDRSGVNYNFGRTNIGDSSPVLSIQETATGNATSTLGSPLTVASGNSSYFTLAGSGSSGCASGTTLAAGKGCTLGASFAPTNAILNQSVTATYTESSANAVPVPAITLTGFAAILTPTKVTVTLTNPSVTPQYAVPFSVTTSVAASACNNAAPVCYPQGSVTIYVDGTSVGFSSLGTGTASSSTAVLMIGSPLAVGQHTITAVYGTDGFYAGNTSSVLTVTIAPESTSGTVSATPNPVAQFSPLTLQATVSAVSGKPTGSVSFYAGTTLLGSAGVTPGTGVATLHDNAVKAGNYVGAYNDNFGLAAGTYKLTAVYSGDANYQASTTASGTLTITAVAQTFTAQLINPANVALAPNIAATYQGATTALGLYVTPSNTLSGTVTLTCTGMPSNSTCGFTPSSLTFIPTALQASAQYTQVTFWTNVNPAVIQAGFGKTWIWMLACAGMLFALRRKAGRFGRAVTLSALAVTLMVSSHLLSGCSAGDRAAQFTTPVGTYAVNVVATGPNGQKATLPVTFTVSVAQ